MYVRVGHTRYIAIWPVLQRRGRYALSGSYRRAMMKEGEGGVHGSKNTKETIENRKW